MNSPSYPGVYIQELTSPVHTLTGVATSIAAFVGCTPRGIDNRAEQIFSFGDFVRLFGGLSADSELSYAVQQFFNNGGTQAYVVRTPRQNASYASVLFGGTSPNGLQFTALSSGSWANGNLLVDVDYNNLFKTVSGDITLTATTAVTGSNTTFQSSLKPGLWLIFSADTTQTPYQIDSITSDIALTLKTAYAGVLPASTTTAAATPDPLAFNLTISNLADGVQERFPNITLNHNGKNYVTAVINDPDNGSQLVNVQVIGSLTAPPQASGLVSSPVLISVVNAAVTATAAIAGTVAINNGSTDVSGTDTSFNSSLKAGETIAFDSDPARTLYVIDKITNDTSLSLKTKFSGTSQATAHIIPIGSTATDDYYLQLSVTSPTTQPQPLPINVRVFSKKTTLPQTIGGLAAQLQLALNNALAVKLPGATVICSVSASGSNQSIRVNALIPYYPDAVIKISSPTGGLKDCSNALGFVSPISQNVSHYSLGTGNGSASNGWNGQQSSSAVGSDGLGLSGTTELIGDPSRDTGIYALSKVDLFNLLSIPDANRASAGNPNTLDSNVDPNTIYSTAITLCKQRRAILLIDPPPNVNTVSAALDWKASHLTVNDANGAAFFPRLKLTDPLNNFQMRTFAPSGVVAGLFARIDSGRGVWKAPAGTEASLNGVQGLEFVLSDAEHGVLNPLGLNCFRFFPVYGNVLWGSRTLQGADAMTSQWKYIPVKRTALYIEESLYRGTQWVVFEPNDEPLWAAIRLNIGTFMQDLFRKGAFQGQTPDEAYLVKCDKETTTQNDINQGIVNILVGFAPLKPAEFVIIQIQQLAGQSQS